MGVEGAQGKITVVSARNAVRDGVDALTVVRAVMK